MHPTSHQLSHLDPTYCTSHHPPSIQATQTHPSITERSKFNQGDNPLTTRTHTQSFAELKAAE